MNLDLTLKLEVIDSKDLFIFDDRVIPTPNEAINRSLPEKIRRFNNAGLRLMILYNQLNSSILDGRKIVEACEDREGEVDLIFRNIVRNIVMESFIYREKIINIICNIFFVEYTKDSKKMIKSLNEVALYFPKLKFFLDEFEKLSKNESYKFIMKIRNDEIHNMSILDSYNWSIETSKSGVSIVKQNFRISAKELLNKIDELMHNYLSIKNMIQNILKDTIIGIYKKRSKMEMPCYVNMNENFDEE